MKCFSIKDLKAEGFNTPFFQSTYGLAERAFNDACQDEKTALYKTPEDFSLWYVGEFDQQTGNFMPLETPKKICDARPKNH